MSYKIENMSDLEKYSTEKTYLSHLVMAKN